VDVGEGYLTRTKSEMSMRTTRVEVNLGLDSGFFEHFLIDQRIVSQWIQTVGLKVRRWKFLQRQWAQHRESQPTRPVNFRVLSHCSHVLGA
jgi:hypothetical protein